MIIHIQKKSFKRNYTDLLYLACKYRAFRFCLLTIEDSLLYTSQFWFPEYFIKKEFKKIGLIFTKLLELPEAPFQWFNEYQIQLEQNEQLSYMLLSMPEDKNIRFNDK